MEALVLDEAGPVAVAALGDPGQGAVDVMTCAGSETASPVRGRSSGADAVPGT